MAILSYRDKDGTIKEIPALRGEKGNPGVYVGSGDMPEDCNVQIDPNGDTFTLEELTNVFDKITDLESVVIDSFVGLANDSDYMPCSYERRIDGSCSYTSMINVILGTFESGSTCLGEFYLPFCMQAGDNISLSFLTDEDFGLTEEILNGNIKVFIDTTSPDITAEDGFSYGYGTAAALWLECSNEEVCNQINENIMSYIEATQYAPCMDSMITFNSDWRKPE